MKERREAIRKYIELRGEVSISDLAKEFSRWSEMTIRRDLNFLASEKSVILTRGGVRTLPSSFGITEDVYSERETRNAAAKQLLAEKAAGLIEEGSGIFVDAGTTAMALARVIPDFNGVIVVSAPNIALELAVKKARPTIILLGGTLSRRAMSVSDSEAERQLSGLNIDTAFLATSGFDEHAGFSVGSRADAMLKRTVISHSRRVVMLLDSSKVGVMLPFTFARPEDVDVLITDNDLPPALRRMLSEQTEIL